MKYFTSSFFRPGGIAQGPGRGFLPGGMVMLRGGSNRCRNIKRDSQPQTTIRDPPVGPKKLCPRESARTNGSKEVSRRETKRVFRARAGRRSTNSRGLEVERSETRRVESNVRTPAYRAMGESPCEGRRTDAKRLGRAEGHVTEGHTKRGGSSRAEPRGLGGPWRRSALSPERVAPG